MIELTALVFNDRIQKSDAIVCLEGDGFERLEKAIALFKKGMGKKIVISGGLKNPPFSVPAKILAKVLIKKGIASKKIILEEKSQNTYEQGLEVMKIAKKKKWKRIILVASHFHQPRAYLTFLRAMKDLGIKIAVFNAPARELPWFKKTASGSNRLQLLAEEIRKIERYQKKGHLVSYKEVVEYQKWKERA